MFHLARNLAFIRIGSKRWLGETHLDQSRASSDGIVIDSFHAAGEDSISLTCETIGDGDFEAAPNLSSRDKGGASDGDEGSIDLDNTIGAPECVSLECISNWQAMSSKR